MSKIKLLETEGLKDGTRRFQSQLWVGGDAANFIMETDGIMQVIGRGEKGEAFYPFQGEYEIVENKSDMNVQVL